MISMNNMVCTRFPPNLDPVLPRRWLIPQSLQPHHAPRMTDKEMYDYLWSSMSRLPPPGACVDEKTPKVDCGPEIDSIRKRVDTMMRSKPLINAVHYPGSRETVEGQHALSPEMAMGHFNTPCSHLRSKTSFNLTKNTPADKALREQLRRCQLPPITAVCNRNANGMIVCTFKPARPPSGC